MVERKEYLDQLEQWREEQVIKVVTGIRRCGKSTLLSQYQDRLKAGGVPAEQIAVSDACTMCRPDVFWSHRATDGRRGVQATVITL